MLEIGDKLLKILLVCTENGLSKEFVAGLSETENTEVVIIEEGNHALEFIGKNRFDLAVTAETLPDMTGIEFVEKLVTVNPMINTAIVSGLSEKDFHEATEGLGVLMSIPQDASGEDAAGLLEYLNKINMMINV